MAYNPTIAGTDRIKNSRPQIQTNFQDIESWTAVDHAVFGAPFEGKHEQVTFPVNTPAAPNPGEIKLWCDNYAPTAQPELFFGNGTSGLAFPLTAALGNANGYTFLPGGLLLKWGSQAQAVTTGGPFIYTFNAAVPFTQIYSAWAVVAATNNPATDVNAVAYITSVGVPAQLTYRIWRRNLFNTPGTNQQPYTVFFLAVGAS